jgi:hypothetical protein
MLAFFQNQVALSGKANLDLSNLEKLRVVFRILSMYKFILRAGSNLTTFGRLKLSAVRRRSKRIHWVLRGQNPGERTIVFSRSWFFFFLWKINSKSRKWCKYSDSKSLYLHHLRICIIYVILSLSSRENQPFQSKRSRLSGQNKISKTTKMSYNCTVADWLLKLAASL